MPIDSNRFEQFKNTKRVYDAMPQKKEFILPTRSEEELRVYLTKHNLQTDVRIVPYTTEVGFNASRALNIGVRHAGYSSVIITSPEVLPQTPVLAQLEPLAGSNVVCQVFDEDVHGRRTWSLVNSRYRNQGPGMYFLAMFNRVDIEKINGWDEEFMKGYAFEDCDFGARWVRSGIPFVIRDDIRGVHQYHPRAETIPGGWRINKRRYYENNRLGITRCANGLVKL